MSLFRRVTARRGQIAAIHQTQAVISFAMDGTIQFANDNFLKVVGYDLAEVRGKHHRLFVDEAQAQSDDYRALWEALRRGEHQSGQFRRVGKDGREVWLQASYTPIKGWHGRPTRVVKFATDITEQKRREAYWEGQITAIQKSQAVIEFAPDGTIEFANEPFLATVGYRLDEIRGQHHRLFVDDAYAESDDYRAFWAKLQRGEHHAGEFQRVGKGGRAVWLQATYNPILGADGRPTKVIKYASDITEQVRDREFLRDSVDEIVGAMGRFAEGDLTVHLEPPRRNAAIDRLYEGFSTAVADLRELFVRINAAVVTAGDASTGIHRSTEQLSASSQEQSAQATEVAAAVEQMVQTIFQNSKHATRAAETARVNGAAAQEGGAVVTQTIGKIREIATLVSESTATVERLGASSRQIGDIAQVIDEIADQTNLLALNAAIEAARAGDQGRGFAVVADEVRKLAERTTGATKEIAQMIRQIQDETAAAVEAMQRGHVEVHHGLELADQAGDALQSIVEGAQDTVDVIAQIAAASEEQSTTSEQMARSVDMISTVSSESAQGIGQIAFAAEDLGRLTGDLRDLVSRFSTGAPAGPSAGASAGDAAPHADDRAPHAVLHGIAAAPATHTRASAW